MHHVIDSTINMILLSRDSLVFTPANEVRIIGCSLKGSQNKKKVTQLINTNTFPVQDISDYQINTVQSDQDI